MKAVRLGIAPIAWTNSDLPELGGETSLETCLRETRQAGFSGTETGVKFPMDPKTLGPILESHDLDLVSGWFSGRLLENDIGMEMDRMRDQLSTFSALGAPVMVYAETVGSVQTDRSRAVADRPVLADTEIHEYGEKLTELASRMAEAGVAMAYHHHMGTVIESARDIDLLMASTGESVGLLLDTGHLTFAGEDPIAVTKRHGARINHVHVKDIRPAILDRVRRERLSFLDAVLAGVFTVPGDGCIDFATFARTLDAIGYEGWIVVEAEQDPAKAPPLEYSIMGHDHLVKALTAAGYTITDRR
ncbi:myo-inosose-2 dehydratase [Fodinicurvata sp. EGI_FJ10296]|uniref:myo-inosose-2 dehydratase n=1 Tax=Fodinicurvata sp. EGI_FJ10296 TaxID=3231908 RepID=UPI003453F19A